MHRSLSSSLPKRHVRRDGGDAFIPDPNGGPAHTSDALAEALGEQYISSATSAEEVGEDALNASVDEDAGGPFVISTAGEEIGVDEDASNPPDAEVEAFPTPVRGPRG